MLIGSPRKQLFGLAMLIACLILVGCGSCEGQKPTTPTDGKKADEKPDDGVDPGDTQPGDTQPGDTQPGDTQPGDTDLGDTEPPDSGNPDSEKPPVSIRRTIYGDVVAIDQPFMINRLGASQPAGMIFVLKSDLVPKTGEGKPSKDNFRLRDGKRPRPIVLRANVGDVLQITFDNWLQSLLEKPEPLPNGTPFPAGEGTTDTQKLAQRPFFAQKTRYAGIHVAGLELVDSISSDGSWVGKNSDPPTPGLPGTGGLVAPGESITYRLYARETGTFLLSSGADSTVHQLNAGLFGAVNVQPTGAEWYRSQTTRCDLQAATLEESELRLQSTIRKKSEAVAEPQTAQSSMNPDVKLEAFSLKTSEGAGVRATSETTVFQDQEGRIFSGLGHPLINYQAVYKKDECPGAVENKPVLSMLKVVPGKPLLPEPLSLQKENYQTEINRLDNGVLVYSLRELFRELGVQLASDASVARVANQNKFSWVVTNPAHLPAQPAASIPQTTYLVQGFEEDLTLTIHECQLQLVHSDLTAIITGPNAGNFPVSQDIPDFYTNPASPDRRQPYREFTIIYHQGGNVVQAFPQWSNNNLFRMISAGLDQFGINYGFAAIGPEIVANRLGVGPMGNAQQRDDTGGPPANQTNDAVDLKYEEFFLSSWCVGDPSMIVDIPANAQNQFVSNPEKGSEILGKIEDNPVQFDSFKRKPASPEIILEAQDGLRPTKAFYPDDPSNVYHSYMRDHTKMRVLHAGPGPAHVHHLHAHQWLHSPNSPEATYLDSQLILPGSTYTLEITYNGSGNRNQTVGDSIFHCHFYPHFAKGMWSLWRVHDTFEEGTWLDDSGICVTKVDPASGKPVSPLLPDGKPNPAYEKAKKVPNRALPDGEIVYGTPTPAVVPLPTLGMAPVPAPVQVADLSPWYDESVGMGRRIHVVPKNQAAIDEAKEKNAETKKKNDESGAKPGDDNYVEGVNLPEPEYDNPGYPFFIPGVGGHRPPHPPMDMAWKESETPEEKEGEDSDKAKWTEEEIENELGLDPAVSAIKPGDIQYLDGGLPRHLILGGDLVSQYQTRWDFTKDFVKAVKEDGEESHVGRLYAFQLPEKGTPIERAAMRAHETRTHASRLPKNGNPGNFILNGLPPTNGAPYADPSVTDDGNSSGSARRYQAAVIQTDVVLNKEGWHYPQQRFITLWEDVAPTVLDERPPQPFFIRTSTGDATEFWHTNLVPNYYELDDFQVRTPTDVIGQHIHLVKFDVTASDGAANGWNYEDGTLGPDEVRERIHSVMNAGGLYKYDPQSGFVDKTQAPQEVAVWPNRYAYPKRGDTGDDEYGLFGPPPPGQVWEGAMTTIQRWAIDPLLNWQGHDRTLRTVFTHDHFSPSTHQQVGLYAGVLVEPEGSQWYLPDGQPMNTRQDGGPTSWQAIIVTANPEDTHREYAIEFQDMQLAYTAESTVGPEGSNALFKPKLPGKAQEVITQQGNVPDYDGQTETAPAAFYIGQASTTEVANIEKYLGSLLNNKLPEDFPALFLNYGIQLGPGTTVIKLYEGDKTAAGVQTLMNARFLIKQPALVNDEGGVNLNGGDYYIVRATNPRPGAIPSPDALSVYTPTIAPGYADPAHAVNPNWGSNRRSTNDKWAGNIGTPGGPPQTTRPGKPDEFGNGPPYPSLVSTRANGTYSMNYRNEPVQLRYRSGVKPWNDLANIFTSPTGIASESPMARQPTPGQAVGPIPEYKFPPPLLPTGVGGGPQATDPYTPLIRGYVGDDIQIRTLVGAHLQPHAFTIHGVNWLAQPSYMNSGYRNVQGMGLSEHFEMRFKMPSARRGTTIPIGPEDEIPDGADYFYSASTGNIGLSNGLWGIMRSYDQQVGEAPEAANKLMSDWPKPWATEYLQPLINNKKGEWPGKIDYQALFEKAKQEGRPIREFNVAATTAEQALPNGTLNYNPRIKSTASDTPTPYEDPNAVIFVRSEDLDGSGKLKDGVPVEPLILRAAAGDWIKVTLTNQFSTDAAPFKAPFSVWWGNPFNNLPQRPNGKANIGEVPMNLSQQVGLHSQLVAFDVTTANGVNVGFNPSSTANPKNQFEYYWYAGNISQRGEKIETVPVEFGATNLIGADLMLQTQFGMVGSLIIEPQGAWWDPNSRAAATIKRGQKGPILFQECVLVMQNMVSNLTPGREGLATQTGPVRQRGHGAVNYRTETFRARGPGAKGMGAPDLGFAQQFSNELPKLSPPPDTTGDPVTPIFTVSAGQPVRFRVVMPSTSAANSAAQPLVLTIHGHGWQDEPYTNDSTVIGHNEMAQFIGTQKVTVTQKYDIVLDSAGGPFRVPGDYLYEAYNQQQLIGVWGIFRVTPEK